MMKQNRVVEYIEEVKWRIGRKRCNGFEFLSRLQKGIELLAHFEVKDSDE